WEVIINDDGSTDGSLEILSNFVKKHKGFILLKGKHGGKASGLWSGIKKAKGEIVLFTDMDQSTPLKEIEKLLPWYNKGFNVVFGSRGRLRKNFPLIRQLTSWGFRVIRQTFLLKNVADTQCGFKSLKKEIALEIFRGKKTKKLKMILGEKEDKVYYSGINTSHNIFNIPENVLFYQYDLPDHNKWIGVRLNIKTDKTEKDGKKIITKEKKITEVIKGTPAEKAGLQKGDIIIAVESDEDLDIGEALEDKKAGDEITLTIERDGKVQDIVVGIDKRKSTKTDENVKVTIDDGEIKILVNGVEKSLGDLEYLREGLDEIEIINDIKLDALDDVYEELEKVKEELEDIDINIEISDTESEL
ncbi:MAG: glycosyltransferase, partial [Candidatus Cloacimonetes bacterium]|nr:glycosyltransferase [Candidatus Cloacimonadota bacterium]